MAISKEYIDFVCTQLEVAGTVRTGIAHVRRRIRLEIHRNFFGGFYSVNGLKINYFTFGKVNLCIFARKFYAGEM